VLTRTPATRWQRCLVTAGALLWASPALAQVGHAPGRSPYHDIPRGHTVTATVAQFGGSGGRLGIAPHDAPLFGLRYDIRTSSPIQIGLGAARGTLDRLIADPDAEVANRFRGPVDQTVTFVELDLQFNVTGGKTWHRLAPFVAVGGGLALSQDTPADTSGFELGRKFYFAPHAGVRFFLTDRIHLRTEARVIFWKLNYPTSFTEAPSEEPDAPPVIDDGRESEWSTSSWLQAGLGVGFSL
jgi:hypothetical protein